MQQQTTDRTVDVSLYVVAEDKEGWRVRAPNGETQHLPNEWALRLSPARVQPTRFRMPRWLWLRVAGDA